MKLAVKICIILVVFVATYLIWPDFGYKLDFDCSNMPANAPGDFECPLAETITYTDAQLGGGWRETITSNSCPRESGPITLYSDGGICNINQVDPPRTLEYELVGSSLVALLTTIVLFRGSIFAKLKK